MATTDQTTRWRDQLSRTDWDEKLTDTGIYLLGLGGFYVGYQVLYDQALAVGFPKDQAVVVAALADLAILLYSRKAVREVKAGRSARVIRTIVALFSLATFSLQLRDAWGNILSVVFHALPPAVWIIGHEMMLRGRLRDAKAARRTAEINAGLRPAPLPRVRLSWWLLAPKSAFTVWRLSKLWQVAPETVISHEAARRTEIPRAWQSVLLTTTAPAPELEAPKEQETVTICTADLAVPEVPALPTPPVIPTLYRLSNDREEVPANEVAVFLRTLPVAPAKGRPKDKAQAYISEVEALGAQYDIKVTGKLLADLLQVDEGRVSKIRKDMATTP
ncbi:DUF2637 domain-containing protein [Streptomyces cellulosae]